MASVYEFLVLILRFRLSLLLRVLFYLKMLPQKVAIDSTSAYYLLFTLALMTTACLATILFTKFRRSMENLHDS